MRTSIDKKLTVVVNTTVVSNFAVINQLTLLSSLFDVRMPIAVYNEIRQGFESGYRFYAEIDDHIAPWSDEGWIQLTPLATDEELRICKRCRASCTMGKRNVWYWPNIGVGSF